MEHKLGKKVSTKERAALRTAGLNVAQYGQVFTPQSIVQLMVALRKNNGRVLEPSAGDGAFLAQLPGAVAIELDARVAPAGALHQDFFAYPDTEKFDSIIGNPPYVAHQDILASTKSLLDKSFFDARANLYLFFIEKALRHLNPGGELIFIVPREFIKLTAARKLNALLYSQGTITHFIETGDAPVFKNAVPNCAIFRFEKDCFDRTMADGRTFSLVDGQLMFLRRAYPVPLSSVFEVRVGAVSGADEIFTHPEGNLSFVCSKTRDTGELRRMFYNTKHPHLEQHREQLLSRKIRSFDESNWWQWGRGYPLRDLPRIYVNAKTRKAAPFFVHECPHFDGSVLALFPREPSCDVQRLAEFLNTQVDWEELGFRCDGRYLFSQRSLASCVLPAEIHEVLNS